MSEVTVVMSGDVSDKESRIWVWLYPQDVKNESSLLGVSVKEELNFIQLSLNYCVYAWGKSPNM